MQLLCCHSKEHDFNWTFLESIFFRMCLITPSLAPIISAFVNIFQIYDYANYIA